MSLALSNRSEKNPCSRPMSIARMISPTFSEFNGGTGAMKGRINPGSAQNHRFQRSTQPWVKQPDQILPRLESYFHSWEGWKEPSLP